MASRGVSVKIGGLDYRVRSDASADQLERVASRVDRTLSRIRDRTGTVDTRDLVMLTALQLARELDDHERSAPAASDERLRALLQSVESELSELRDRDA